VVQTQTPINPGSSGGPLLDDNLTIVGINAFLLKQGLNFAISVGEIKRFLEMPGNRLGTKQADRSDSVPPLPPAACKESREFSPFVDQNTKKLVTPFDTLCRGRPNMWVVGDPPEYSLYDRMGDGKVDIKIVYKFAPDVDLWIVFGMRDNIPTMFGYDYGRQGKPDRWVSVGPSHQ
jgi:hypothetical protein